MKFRHIVLKAQAKAGEVYVIWSNYPELMVGYDNAEGRRLRAVKIFASRKSESPIKKEIKLKP